MAKFNFDTCSLVQIIEVLSTGLLWCTVLCYNPYQNLRDFLYIRFKIHFINYEYLPCNIVFIGQQCEGGGEEYISIKKIKLTTSIFQLVVRSEEFCPGL